MLHSCLINYQLMILYKIIDKNPFVNILWNNK